MKRNIIFLLAISFVFIATNLYAEDCPLKGKWKSSSKQSLESAKKNVKLSQKQIDYLTNEVFGKLEVEFTCNEFISQHEKTINKQKYKIIKTEGNFITIRHYEKTLGEYTDNTIELRGNCYYVPVHILGVNMKEAMCKEE